MVKKRLKKYKCKCGYTTDRISNLKAHKNKKKKCIGKNECEICGKIYKYKSGLSRHKKNVCNKFEIKFSDSEIKSPDDLEINNIIENSDVDEDIDNVIVFSENIEDNIKKTKEISKVKEYSSSSKYDKLLDVIMEQNKTITEQMAMFSEKNKTLSKSMTLLEESLKSNKALAEKAGNNNNNKISINVYLNKYCKNALNLTDFMNNLKITIDDIMYTRDYGRIKGIENILTKQLISLSPQMRPIHCSDKKRQHFYIKDKNSWNKENSDKKIKRSLDWITKKQLLGVVAWEKDNPDYIHNEKKSKERHSMLEKILKNDDNEKCINNVRKMLANKTYLNLNEV